MLWVKKIEPASDTVKHASPTDAAAWVTASRPNGFNSYVRGSRVTIAAARLPGGLPGHRGHPVSTGRQGAGHVGDVAASIGFLTVRSVDPEPPPGSAGTEYPRSRLRPRSIRLPGWIAPGQARGRRSVRCSPCSAAKPPGVAPPIPPLRRRGARPTTRN